MDDAGPRCHGRARLDPGDAEQSCPHEGGDVGGAEAGELATRTGAKQLVVTHVPPWHDPFDALAEAKAVYDGPLELASAGTVYDV